MDNMDRTAVGMTSFRRLRHTLLERKDDYDLKQQDFAVVDIKVSDFKNYMDAYGEVFCQCLMEEAARKALGSGLDPVKTCFVGKNMIMSLVGYENRSELRALEREIRRSLGRIHEISSVPCRPDFVVKARTYSEMSYMERLMLLSHHRARGGDHYSIEEMQLCMQEMRRFFQVVRLVNPSEMREVYFDAQGRVRSSDHHCYKVWRRDGRCENCTSARACTQKGSFVKFEFLENEIYFVVSQPVIVDGKVFVLELVRNVNSSIEESLLEKMFGNEEFAAKLTASRNSIYRDEVTGLHNRKYFAEQIAGLNAIAVALFKLDNRDEICRVHGSGMADRVLATYAATVERETPINSEVIRFEDDKLLLMMDYISYREFFELLASLQGKLRWSAEDVCRGMELNTSISGVYGYGITSELALKARRTMERMENAPNRLVVREDKK